MTTPINWLTCTLLTPSIGVLMLIPVVEEKQNQIIKRVALNTSSVAFILSLIIWLVFKKNTGNFQFVTTSVWVSYFNLNCPLGIDGISLFFLLLTTLLFILCNVISWNKTNNTKNYFLSFLILEFFLVGAFCSSELFMFYIFFESVLIPMFLIIGIWGSRQRKIKASYYFFLYTLLGSILMLLSIIYVQAQLGTTNYEVLLTFSFYETEQKLIWFSFFVFFSSKVLSLPVPLWLPEAHVEAPTAGSIILAGILLKLGTYGFIRFSIPVLPKASFFFAPLIYFVCVVSLIYTSFTAIRQTDFKRIIAYTSIAHMNLVVLGIFIVSESHYTYCESVVDFESILMTQEELQYALINSLNVIKRLVKTSSLDPKIAYNGEEMIKYVFHQLGYRPGVNYQDLAPLSDWVTHLNPRDAEYLNYKRDLLKRTYLLVRVLTRSATTMLNADQGDVYLAKDTLDLARVLFEFLRTIHVGNEDVTITHFIENVLAEQSKFQSGLPKEEQLSREALLKHALYDLSQINHIERFFLNTYHYLFKHSLFKIYFKIFETEVKIILNTSIILENADIIIFIIFILLVYCIKKKKGDT